MSFPEIKGAVEQTAQSVEAFKQSQGRRIEELKNNQEALLDRIETIESKGVLPGRTAANFETKQAAEHQRAFNDWMRKPNDVGRQALLGEMEAKAMEHKDITIGSQSGGGYAVPMQIHSEIEKRLGRLNPLRDLVKVMQVGSSDFKELMSLNNATSGWAGETSQRPGTVTPTLRERKPTHGELYAYPQVSEWALDDIFFNVADWLAESVSDSFSEQEAEAILNGNGTNKPTGIFNSTPTAVSDDAGTRAPDVIEYVPSGNASLITADSLFDLVYRVKSQYLNDPQGVAWLMSRSTLAAVAKLKTAGGDYLLQPALSAQVPMSLLGYPVRTTDYMSPVAAGNFPIAFGNFRRGYLLVERGPARITPDPYTNIGFVKFYVRRREGGIVLNNDAIKCLKIGTS